MALAVPDSAYLPAPWWAFKEPVNGGALRNTATTAIIMLMYVYRAQPKHNLSHRNCMRTHCIARTGSISRLLSLTGGILSPLFRD